jgi:hypothetical protein
MNSKRLLRFIALLSLAINAQTSTAGTPAGQSPAPSAQTATPSSPDDDPAFKKLSPQEQAWTRQWTERLNKAIADKDTNAIDQLGQEAQKHLQQAANANSAPHYVYAANNPAATNAQPAKPAAPSPCVAMPPKKQTFLDKLKQHAQRTLEAQAGKADAQINKASKGNVDAGVKDTTTSAVNDANQAAPCPPAKSPSAKQ